MIENRTALEAIVTKERSILRNVYVWMTLGLALTGIVALGVASNESLMRTLIGNRILFWGIIIAQFALVWFLSARIGSISPGTATVGFAVYSVLNGVTLSFIFLAYTGVSIAQTFFVTAGTFGGMSLYALTTKRDLSKFGSYLIMGLWGLIIASVVNIFLRNSGFEFLISIFGVLLFTGLTAYDTQMIRRLAAQMGDDIGEADYVRVSIIGALKLYLDFINLFLFMLRLVGGRRSE